MHRGFLLSLLALAWLASTTVGCAAGPAGEAESAGTSEIDSPSLATRRIASYEFESGDYDAVFDTAIVMLRDQGFRIARATTGASASSRPTPKNLRRCSSPGSKATSQATSPDGPRSTNSAGR
ncbi:hypothetical protein OT109_11165 [Phycisphaeraceae bacterium D3-23]